VLIAVSVFGSGGAFYASAARAGLACFDGPRLDHEDKAYAYWLYANNCNGSVIINYQIKSVSGEIETGTTSIGACRDGSLIDLKGEYHFDIKGSDKSKSERCLSKADSNAGDDAAPAESQGQNNEVYPAHPARAQNRTAAAAGDTMGDGDNPLRQDLDPEDMAGDTEPGMMERGVTERFARQFDTRQFAMVPGPDRCWRQKATRTALLICCDSKQLCEATCLKAIKKSINNACGSACGGAAEYAPAKMNCYWAH